MTSRKADRKAKKRQVLLERAVRLAQEGSVREQRAEREREDRANLQAQKEEEARRRERVRAQSAELRAALSAQEAALQERAPVLTREILPAAAEPEPPAGLLERFRQGIRKTRDSLVGGLARVMVGRKELDGEALERLEELLLTADLGLPTTRRLLRAVEERSRRADLGDVERLKAALREEVRRILARGAPPEELAGHRPTVVLLLGVNGVGKTTTLGKLASRYAAEGRRVLMAAGDTFRAAAGEQLTEWSRRVGCDLVSRPAGSDPSAVIHQAVRKGVDEGYDVVLCDTAGRLHTKVNLMEELKKIQRVIGKALPGAPHETWLVLDANTGQNAVLQTRDFHQALGLTGLIVTKLDGTARGGVVVGIVNEFDLPVRYVGVGEGVEDLQPFDPAVFAESLLS